MSSETRQISHRWPLKAKASSPLTERAAPVVLFAGALVAAALSIFARSEWPGLAACLILAGVLSALSSWFVARMLRIQGPIALISPPVMATFVSFVPSFIVPVLLMPFLDDTLVNTQIFTGDSNPIPWITRTLLLSIGCSLAMWAGFGVPFVKSAGTSIRQWLIRSGVIRPYFLPSVPVMTAMVIIAAVSLVIEVRLGVFGYASNYAALFQYAQYRSFLDYGLNLLTLALFLAGMRAFLSHRDGQASVPWFMTFWILFFVEIAIGFLSGFKGLVMFPALVAGITYYICFQRIPLQWGLAAAALLAMAFVVIEPFRALRYENTSFSSTSFSSIVGTLEDSLASGSRTQHDYRRSAVGRSELISVTSAAIRHADAMTELHQQKPPFMKDIVLSPVLAFVPRAIWKSKPTSQIGYWFAVSALGQPPEMKSSTGMGPISYFYYIGGTLGALIGFFCIGVLMSLLWEVFPPVGAGGWLVYLALLQPFAVLPGEIGPSLVKTIQLLPLALGAQWIALRRPPTMA